MIQSFLSDYRRSDRDINVLACVVIAFLMLLSCRAAILIYENRYLELWNIIPMVVSLLSILVIIRVANRLISNGNITREDDRRLEIVRVTHHLIAIAKDLRSRVGFVKTTLKDGGRPSFVLAQIANSIEERYEALLDKDAYKFLPGPCVDRIIGMSGSIFGIMTLAEGVRQTASGNADIARAPLPATEGVVIKALDDLMNDIQKIIDEVYSIRQSIDTEKKGGNL